MLNTRVWRVAVAACTGAVVALGLATRASVSAASPADSITAGEFIVDPPTLINLGFEWFVQGDDNRNAGVDRHGCFR